MGLSPFEAPATFSMMPFTEMAHGVWYPKGGMYSLVEALMTIAEEGGCGVCVQCQGCPHRDKRETRAGCAAGGRSAPGWRMLSLANADLPYVYENLLPADKMVKSLARKRYSCSVLSFFWGVDKPYPSSWPPHPVPGG